MSSALVLGLFVWYCYYTIECIVNGAMEEPWLVAFVHLVNDIKHNLPFVGWKYRLKSAGGNEDWAKQFPGRIYFFIVHILIPFGPALVTTL